MRDVYIYIYIRGSVEILDRSWNGCVSLVEEGYLNFCKSINYVESEVLKRNNRNVYIYL